MGKTLVLLFHPNMKRSRANAALASAAADLDDVDVVDMQAVFPQGLDLFRDAEGEAARLLEAERIVLQFPVQWYSTPPLLKAWEDAVLTRMFYIAYEEEGLRLEGRPLMLAATAGNVREAYQPGGANLFSMDSLFAPLKATAHRCGLVWYEPFLLYRADKLGPNELKQAGADYARALSTWIEKTPAREAA